jgi:peptidyl-prolyl cis-trans isomerase B (cyclophilin B)
MDYAKYVRIACAGVFLFVPALVGCGSSKPIEATPSGTQAASPVSTNASEPQGASPNSSAEKASVTLNASALSLPFESAVRPADQPPVNAGRPPDTTFTGLPVYKIMRRVQDDWPEIRFVDDSGKPLRWIVDLNTDLGAIQIEMLPQLAPNHARNFLALVRAGYYRGMRFDRVRQEELVDAGGKESARVDQLEAGCPLGTGESGGGSLGYWMKHETSEQAHHVVGMVGACRDEEADTGGARFFILMSESPHLDGHQVLFGRVTRGLDVARAIMAQAHGAVAGMEKPPVTIKEIQARQDK